MNKTLFLENDHLSRCWMNVYFSHAGRAISEVFFAVVMFVYSDLIVNVLLSSSSIVHVSFPWSFFGVYTVATVVVHLTMIYEKPVHRYPPQIVVDRITQSTPSVFNNVDLEHFHNFA